VTAESILLRPLGPGLARRVAVTLASVFALVLVLAWLAVESLAPVASPGIAANPPARSAVRPAANMLPPAGVLAFRPRTLDGALTADTLLDPAAAASLADWTAALRDRPGTRVTLTLSSADNIDEQRQHRVGAALVRLLTAGDINPHRVQLVLAPAGNGALSPGEFRLAIEMGRP